MAVTTAPVRQPDLARACVEWTGGVSTADDDILLDIDGRGFEEYIFGSTAGAVDVLVSLDGTNFFSTPIGLLNPTDNAPDAETTANTVFILRGVFRRLRFQQDGATGVSGFSVNARVILR